MKKIKYGKYGSMIIVLLLLMTIFVAMQGNATVPNSEKYVVKKFSVDMNSVRYVVSTNGHLLLIDGLKLMNAPGYPILPYKVLRVYLPRNANVKGVSISDEHYQYYPEKVKISMGTMPVMKDGRKLPTLFSLNNLEKKMPGKDKFYPEKEIAYKIGKTNDGTVVNVYVYPAKYDPVKNEAKILTNANIKVVYTLTREGIKAPPINVPNIIITSPELKDQAQRLADFHNSTGVNSSVVTTDWISAHYSEAEKPPVKGYGDAYTNKYNNPITNQKLPLKHDNIVGYNDTLARKIVSFLRDEMGGSVKYITIFGNARMVPPSYYWVDQLMYLIAHYYELNGYPPDYYDAWIPTDAFYESPDYTSTSFDFTPNFEVGRIPVNPLTAKMVVNKIIYYGQHKAEGIRNITLSGGQVFETPYFLGETAETEPLDNGWFNGLNITEYFHTLRNYTFDNFMKMMYNSDMVIEVTHGSGFSLWHHNDEVSAWDFPINGSYGSLPIYVSGSCLDGAWDEEVYPSYEISSGINGGTSMAEKLVYSPGGSIAYIGADREAYGSTYAYFVNGTLVAPNDFGDLITEDGTSYGYYKALKDNGVVYLGDLGYWARTVYQSWVALLDNVSLSAVDPFNSGWNDNPWARSYFEYSMLGDPALKIGSNLTTPSNYYTTPKVEVIKSTSTKNVPSNDADTMGIPMVPRGTTALINITTNSTYVHVELLYLEHDIGYSPYMRDNEETYYDFILDEKDVTLSGGYAHYFFTPNREGIYILSVYTPDGKNTRLYIFCNMPQVPPPKVHYNTRYTDSTSANYEIEASSNIKVVTILDYEDVIIGKSTNATAVIYNSGDTAATNVDVHFYLENYTLVFNDKNLNKPLVDFGNVTVGSIPAHGYAYVTINWTAHDLYREHPSWDPYHSSARWQYFVVSAGGSQNWALFRVHLPVDVWAQKVFIEKNPACGVKNNVSIELTNLGFNDTSQTTVVVKDKFETITTTTVNIASHSTIFLKIPWTPKLYGNDSLSVDTHTINDINNRNDDSKYYPNGYNGVSQFKVLNYDLTPINITQENMNLKVEVYNFGPNPSDTSKVEIYQIPGAKPIDIESPHPYPNNYCNTWALSVPGASQIAIHFKYIEVEKDYDYLNITDGSHNLVVSYTGTYTDIWTPLISGSVAYITLTSDIFVNYSGFYVDLYALQRPILIHVGDANFNSIASGNYASAILPINSTNHVVSGQCAFKLVSVGSSDVATLTTGGRGNNVLTISGKISETNDASSTPNISLLAPLDNEVVGPQVNVFLSLNDTIASMTYNATVIIDGNNITTKFQFNNNWTLNGTLRFIKDGIHAITISVTDSGDHRSNEISFTLISAHMITFITPKNNSVIKASNVYVKWAISENDIKSVELWVDNGQHTDVTGKTNATLHLDSGTHRIYLKATNDVGNVTVKWISVKVQIGEFNIASVNPSSGSKVSGTSVVITFTFSNPVNTTTLKYTITGGKYKLGGITWKDNNTVLEIKLTNLERGKKYTITINHIANYYGDVIKGYVYTFQTTSPESSGMGGIGSMGDTALISGIVIAIIIVAIVAALLMKKKKKSEVVGRESEEEPAQEGDEEGKETPAEETPKESSEEEETEDE